MFEAVQWIKEGGALPPNRPELLAALTQTTYTFKNDKLIVEPKEIIKEKLGYSPDEMDAFILTFAAPVIRATSSQNVAGTHAAVYDPFQKERIQNEIGGRPKSAPYNPLSRETGRGR